MGETAAPQARVRLDVYCCNDHLIGTWYDSITEKYPFFCERCDTEHGNGDCREGKSPWYLTAAIETTWAEALQRGLDDAVRSPRN
jgi:hypothetical protein